MPNPTAELRDLNDIELANKLREAREELFNLRFQLATGELESFSRISDLRRTVARCHTLLREREIALAEEPEDAGADR
ncbi:MAG: 50S ribosomal protein L29 [Acidimicrobiia bacterium]